MTPIESLSLSKRFEHLLTLLSSGRFLRMEGLGNEIPFFICPFAVGETAQMYRAIPDLAKQLQTRQITVLELNLYQIILDILKQREILHRIIDIEQELSKAELFEQLQSVLDPEKHIIPAIEARMSIADYQILFINGVGEVFPYLRLHSIMNNMQKIPHDKPTVFFFPGEYNAEDSNGSTLKLFGKLEDRYYRAFNIYHCLAN